ncbi:helix-turn-helix transcriptional regulator [Mesobacillus subterraneus]|uniref:helix-turn-helix domain-containing protein n=1 Tax=Mesobacillus subterraneus TaxID=285983 RepID=UPI0020406C6F|nr:helix-turn-helix domain-containing protein [Mesobacillus subterraneus]MCM3664545.1 helix-turn-helix transcriptional regulator [Mesobacillus subterraneus]MCM3683939.1 helix-turn-helix transcriptional regulator [Mesobacillus subterraneus]
MSSERLGEEIHFYRKKADLSQGELAKGICSQSAISRIEAGEVYPSIDVLYLIALKLHVPIEHFLNVTFHDYTYYIKETIKTIESLNKAKRYQEVYEITSLELKNKKTKNHIWFNQFLYWNFYMSCFYINKIDYLECIHNLENLCVNEDTITKKSFQELRIKNVIANLYAENKHYPESIQYYNDLVASLNSSNLAFDYEGEILLIKIYYNYGKTLYAADLIGEAINIIDNGIKLSKELENISYLGQLYYQKGLCLETKKEKVTNISELYINAYRIFEILDKKEYLNITLEKKRKFIAPILN